MSNQPKEIMGWESSVVNKFGFGCLQTMVGKLKLAYNSLIIGATVVRCEAHPLVINSLVIAPEGLGCETNI